MADQQSDPTATEPDTPATVTPTARPLRKRTLLALGTAGVAFVAITVTAVFYGVSYYRLAEHDDAAQQARRAVCDYAKRLVTYDYNHLDQYYKQVDDGATGEFKSLWSGQGMNLKQDLVDGQVSSRATNITCGVASGSDTHATVVVSIAQIVTSVATKGQPTHQPPSSIVATADKIDGRWLVSRIGPRVLP